MCNHLTIVEKGRERKQLLELLSFCAGVAPVSDSEEEEPPDPDGETLSIVAKFQPLLMETMTKSKDGFLGVGVLQAPNSGMSTPGGLGAAPGGGRGLLSPVGFAVAGPSCLPQHFRVSVHSEHLAGNGSRNWSWLCLTECRAVLLHASSPLLCYSHSWRFTERFGGVTRIWDVIFPYIHDISARWRLHSEL